MTSHLENAIEIAHEAGALLRHYFERRVRFELKGDFDLVTEADRASEKLIVERLTSLYPDHGILAEEGSGHRSSSEYRWYVDPLDGTTNFAHSYPVFNVTLALEKAGELIAGVVFDPYRNELFTCEKGGGAYLNGGRIHVSRAPKLDECLFSTGFPSRRRHLDVNIHFYYQLAMASHGVRRGGSAAIDLAYVACGRLDGYWEFGLSPWDMAAGKLLVQEAGGSCSDMHGAAHQLTSAGILADNGHIHGEVLDLFSEIFGGEFRHPMPVLPVTDQSR
ncbi:MAG TPA: inositol monophosphatase family protein [Bryobacteraceae bacterium]|nr:inositol monophosphatase family protein [Bryobacteraceae bacterium]